MQLYKKSGWKIYHDSIDSNANSDIASVVDYKYGKPTSRLEDENCNTYNNASIR